METTIDKIIHHITFTVFWGLVLALVIITIMRFYQWDNQSIHSCLDRGYTINQCKGN